MRACIYALNPIDYGLDGPVSITGSDFSLFMSRMAWGLLILQEFPGGKISQRIRMKPYLVQCKKVRMCGPLHSHHHRLSWLLKGITLSFNEKVKKKVHHIHQVSLWDSELN